MANNNNILITGANRGIGLELIKVFKKNDFFSIGTFRNKQKSKELIQLQSKNTKILKMDVVKEDSVIKASKKIELPLDYLICNAGVNNGFGGLFDKDHNYEDMLEVLNVNILGCILTIKHFSKHLRNGAKIILISSILGVQKHEGSNAMIYRASKAAVNNIMVSISEEFRRKKIIVCSFHPGWVRTDMGGPNATLSTEESASSLFKSFQNLTFESTGKFLNYDGSMLAF